jgi:hypothetical protein
MIPFDTSRARQRDYALLQSNSAALFLYLEQCALRNVFYARRAHDEQQLRQCERRYPQRTGTVAKIAQSSLDSPLGLRDDLEPEDPARQT